MTVRSPGGPERVRRSDEQAQQGCFKRRSSKQEIVHEKDPKGDLLAAVLQNKRMTSIPDRARTCNLRLRRPTLYPIGLRGREIRAACYFSQYDARGCSASRSRWR